MATFIFTIGNKIEADSKEEALTKMQDYLDNGNLMCDDVGEWLFEEEPEFEIAKNPCSTTIETGCFGVTVNTTGDGGCSITSDLHAQFAEPIHNIEWTKDVDTIGDAIGCAAADALESFILAMVGAGYDIDTPAFKEALETAVQSIGNNM